MKLQLFTKAGAETVNRKIFKAALIVGALTLVARVGTVLKELVVAQRFGRSDALDAFLIAFLLPSFVVTIVSGTVGSAMVPVFVEVQQKEGRLSAERLLSSISLISAAALGAAAILLGLFAPFYLPYLAHGFSAEKLNLTRELLYPLLPWMVLSGTAQLITYILNAGEKFALPAIVPLTTPLVVIGSILFVGRGWGPFALSTGSCVGSVLETTVLLRILAAHGLTPRSFWGGYSEHVREVLAQCAPLLAGAVLMASTPVVNQSVAAMLSAGSVSALGYANRIITGITALGATALSTATLPYFSRMAANHDWNGCRHTLKRYSTLIVATAVPFTLLFMACSRTVTRLLYQRGAFTAADTEMVAHVQSLFAIQIPFVMLAALLVRFLSSVRRNDLLLYVSVANLIVNVALNLTLARVWGVAGIACAASIMYIVSFVFLTLCVWILVGRERSPSLAPGKPRQAGN